MLILIVGPQGSGKSTQGKLLARKKHLHFISTGAMFRRLYEMGEEIGIKAFEYTERGELVPDHMTNQVLRAYLKAHPSQFGYVIDGYPRNVEQFEDSVLPGAIDVVIYLELSSEEIVDRIKKRNEIEGRSDGTDEAIKTRTDIYHEETIPLLASFEESQIPIITVDASQSIRDIQEEIVQKLEQIPHHGTDTTKN